MQSTPAEGHLLDMRKRSDQALGVIRRLHLGLLLLIGGAGLGCTGGGASHRDEPGLLRPAAPRRISDRDGFPNALPTGSTDTYRYAVRMANGGEHLFVRSSFPVGCPVELRVDDDAEHFVNALAVSTDDGQTWRALSRSGKHFLAPQCAHGCTIRYRFDLGAAADAIDREGWAARRGRGILAPPSTWLMHPVNVPADATYEFKVEGHGGAGFATGVFATSDPGAASPDAIYGGLLSYLPSAPYSAFGSFERERIRVEGGVIDVAFLSAAFERPRSDILDWIRRAAADVALYYGSFPVPRVQVIIMGTPGSGFGFSRVLGFGGASILAPLGRSVTPQKLTEDWQMTHEMLHLGLPNVGDEHAWFEEGVATYAEPIARVRRGRLDVEQMWGSFAKSMPQGQPKTNDRGLAHTDTWGRRYWGGAAFCLLADVEIRRRTDGRHSLEDVFAAVQAAGGNVSVVWPMHRLIEVGDQATGVPVLAELYAKYADASTPFPLDQLFRDLGVELQGARLGRAKPTAVFDDGAPLSHIRRAIAQSPTVSR